MHQIREIKDSVIVITGASSGIGLATAKALVAKGARVVVSARDTKVLDEFFYTVGEENALAVPCDIRKPADCERLMAAAIEKFGRIDSLIANAGIGLYGGIMDYTNERLNEMMETNLQGTIWSVRAAVPFLKKNGGDVLIICSISGYRSKRNQAVYAATKHAQVGLAIGLDDELREDGIRVSVIAPAATDTNFAVGGGRELSDSVRSGYLQASDIAYAVETGLQQPRRMRTTLWQMISMSQGIV